MYTTIPEGLHIYVDNKGDDLSCCAIKTSNSSHIVVAYTSIRTSTYRSLYLRSLTNSGVLGNAVLAPDVTDYNQLDASLAPVARTDDFVAVWSSNAQGSYKIFARRFTIDEKGNIIPKSTSVQISQSNGDYYAPRIVYNKPNNIFFVTWFSSKEKCAQSVFLKNDDNLSPAGYEGSLQTDISADFYTTTDLSNSLNLSVSLFNAADKIIVAYNNKPATVSIFEYSYKAGVAPAATKLTEYSARNTITNFTMAFDEINSEIKIVFSDAKDTGHIYGDSIQYFGQTKKVKTGAPVRLNQTTDICKRPFIKRVPFEEIKKVERERTFVVGWETAVNGVMYNKFSNQYNALSFEQEINKGDQTTDKPIIVATGNQTLILVQASKFNNESLSDLGLLMNVS
ncbi:hypothetical protein [Enterobacter cloacae]|uniref:hypothetical protein n=1 Tax=Enterobacter cloacae TaxID=550 RepID=UPI003353C904